MLATEKLNLTIKQKFKRWINRRMLVSDCIRLNQRSSYILPSKTGLLMALMITLMIIGATNYQNNLAFMLTFLLIGIGLVSIVFTFNNLQGIQFSLLPSSEAFAGKIITVPLNLQSTTGKNHYSIGIGESKNNLFFCDVSTKQNSQIKIQIQALPRGYHQLPRLITTSQFPFGWLTTWSYFQFKSAILVYPEPIEPPDSIHINQHEQESETENKTTGSDQLYGLRTYRTGEPLNRVDWKAYAREKGMFSKEFVDYKSNQHCFNWNDFPNTSIEKRLSYLTFMVLSALAQNLCYSLVLPNLSIESGEGEQHSKQCLQALALFNKTSVNKASNANVEKAS